MLNVLAPCMTVLPCAALVAAFNVLPLNLDEETELAVAREVRAWAFLDFFIGHGCV